MDDRLENLLADYKHGRVRRDEFVTKLDVIRKNARKQSIAAAPDRSVDIERIRAAANKARKLS